MQGGAAAATGLARRRARVSDQETERRMLDAAIAMVNRAGLTVSLEHISFEEVIREARVSRSTVYRRWPYKDLFFSDLLKELARAEVPAAIAGERAGQATVDRVIRGHLDWLDTPEGRHDLVLELIREGALHDFETVHGSTEWRTYLALHATFLSVADEGLRAELQAALARSERDFIRRIAASWERFSRLLGYRLRAELDATFETIAMLASADLRGFVIMSLADPEIGTRSIRARPFGTRQVADWSPPGLATASIAVALLEPDPDVEWSAERREAVLRALGPEVRSAG